MFPGSTPIAIMDKVIGEQTATISRLESELDAAKEQIAKLNNQLMHAKYTDESLRSEIDGWREYGNGLKAALGMALDRLAGNNE